MFSVAAGTDTYGRVKTVAGMPIVTKFFMLQLLPIFPLKSFYLIKLDSAKVAGVPFVASVQSSSIHGFPLARVDKISVVMAYLRAFLALLLVVSVPMLVVAVVSYFTGAPGRDTAEIVWGALAALVGGSVAGGLTYVLPLTTKRERDIRLGCRELLGAAIDPVRLPADLRQLLAEYVRDTFRASPEPRERLLARLVFVRAKLPHAANPEELEAQTDQLLGELARTAGGGS